MSELQKKIALTQQIEADNLDQYMIEQIKSRETEEEGIRLHQLKKAIADKTYTGKLSVRLPKTLHRELAESAKKEGISLNQFVLYKLAR
jgi:antitoxin HicB